MVERQATPQDRLPYAGSLEPVVERIGTAYGLDTPTSFALVETGYEDCNVKVTVGDSEYLAKMFAKTRKPEEVARYVGVISAVVEAGIHHPKLRETQTGEVLYTDETGISLVLLDYVPGHTFFEINRQPDEQELRKTVEQAAQINRLNLRPPYLDDSWSVQNLGLGFTKVSRHMTAADRKLVERVVADFSGVPLKGLPQAFVHGDLTKANVLLGDDGEVYVLDFSVANRYPRIQELAVISANLTFDGSLSLAERVEVVAGQYQQIETLTDTELKYLYPYALSAVAMEFIGSCQEKYLKGDTSDETDYWLELGRSGLYAEVGR